MADAGRDTENGKTALAGLAEALPGLVWAYAYDGDGLGQPVAGPELAAAMQAADGWLWLHFNLANPRAREWIEAHAPIPETAREVLLDSDDHLCLIADDHALTGVFADFRREFDHGTRDIARLKFALYGRLLVTGRRQALHSVDEVRRATAHGSAFESGEALLEQIFDNFTNQVSVMTRELADQLEVMEERVVDDHVEYQSLKVGPIRRTALRLSRQVGALRIHFSALVENPERDLPEDVFEMAERVSLRLSGVARDIESIQDRARIIQEEATAKAANTMNTQLKTLSALTALFLPATLVTGLFGMNTHGLPFDSADTGFWYALAVCMGGSGVVYLILRRLGLF